MKSRQYIYIRLCELFYQIRLLISDLKNLSRIDEPLTEFQSIYILTELLSEFVWNLICLIITLRIGEIDEQNYLSMRRASLLEYVQQIEFIISHDDSNVFSYYFGYGLRAFSSGLRAFSSGLREFPSGLDEFSSGLRAFSSGLRAFSSGLDEFSFGLDEFSSGLRAFSFGLRKFSSDRDEFSSGLRAFSFGLRKFSSDRDEFSSDRDEFSYSLQISAGEEYAKRCKAISTSLTVSLPQNAERERAERERAERERAERERAERERAERERAERERAERERAERERAERERAERERAERERSLPQIVNWPAFFARISHAFSRASERNDAGAAMDTGTEPIQLVALVSGEKYNPKKPLKKNHKYVISFQSVINSTFNKNSLFSQNESRVASEDIPQEGLKTTWIITSEDLVFNTLKESGNTVQVGAVVRGKGNYARFPLVLFPDRDSVERSFQVMPRSASSTNNNSAVMHLVIIAEKELYRQCTLTVRVEQDSFFRTLLSGWQAQND